MTPLHLIAYDVADPRRLGRVHRYLKKRAVAVQYSVFVTLGSDDAITTLATGLRGLVDARHDDVRIYRLPQPCRVRTLGRQILPPGMFLGGEPDLHRFQPAAIELPSSDSIFLATPPATGSIIRR